MDSPTDEVPHLAYGVLERVGDWGCEVFLS